MRDTEIVCCCKTCFNLQSLNVILYKSHGELSLLLPCTYEKLSLNYSLNSYQNFQTSGAKTFVPICNLENQISSRDVDNKILNKKMRQNCAGLC